MSASRNKKARRAFLKGAGFALGAGALAACGQGPRQAERTAGGIRRRSLRMVTTWPKDFPGTGTAAARFAERIGTLSEGAITIRVYAGGELVPALGAFDAVSEGKADFYHGAEYYWQGRSPAFNFFAAVPFGLTAPEAMAWVDHDGGQALWDELSASFNVKPFMCGNSGTQMGGWFNKEINTLADLKGLRIRIPGLGGEVYHRLGATPVTKAGSEIFLALSQGNIDATEWIGPWNDMAFGLHTIAKYYYYPGFHEPGSILSLGVNLDLWKDFSDTEKALFANAAAAENAYTLSEFNAENGRALADLLAHHNVELRRFPDEVLRAMSRVADDILRELAGADVLTRRVVESFTAARARLAGWSDIADRAFMNARALQTE
jgi:TRAP-type mannitol/chloroaromatic compound transport system substrate-binding protein